MKESLKKEVAHKITKDIDNGVYDRFPFLKERLNHIKEKLVKSIHTKNTVITGGEVATLEENDYIGRNKF